MTTTVSCSECGTEWEDRWRCTCGKPLDFSTQPDPPATPPTFDVHAIDRGIWAFADFIPITPRVSLGEGFTGEVHAPAWDVTFKLEYVSPTGSFKDRGAAAVVSRALDCGATSIIEDSSGNAGAAIATYAAQAGIPAKIFVPASAKQAKRKAIERVGATLIPISGTRQDATEACIEAVKQGEGWYASHAWNPAFLAGTATFAYEIAAQRAWSVPDAVVLPLGHGTLFLGAYRGFKALYEAGWTQRLPRLLGAQASGWSPIADEFHETSSASNSVADGIQIAEPVRKHHIFEAIEATNGDAIAITEEQTREALDRLHRKGFSVEATSPVAVAASGIYRERGVLSEDDDVVVALSGSGLKLE